MEEHENPSPDRSAPATAPSAAASSAPRPPSLRQRVERLEALVAQLGDSAALEQRVVARLTQTNSPALPGPASAPLSEVPKVNQVEAVPIAKPAPVAPMATLAEFALPAAPMAPPATAAALPFSMAANTILGMLPVPSLLKEIAWDFRTLAKLLLDRLYPTTLAFKIVPLFALLYVFVWPVVSPFLGWLVLVKFGPLLGVFTDGVVLYVAFKVIQRELHRYHAFAVKYHR